MSQDEPRYEVVSPEPPVVDLPRDFTVGVADLGARTIAQLWDGLFRGDELMAIIAAALRERFPGVRFIGHEVVGTTHGRDEAELLRTLPELLRDAGADLAMSGLGA